MIDKTEPVVDIGKVMGARAFAEFLLEELDKRFPENSFIKATHDYTRVYIENMLGIFETNLELKAIRRERQYGK